MGLKALHKTPRTGYLLFVLTTIWAFNQVDRLALGVVQENIKISLSLSDTELGFLNGIAFAFFYSVMGWPVARWADQGNRVTIITLTTAVWSVMVAICGAARSFAQLLLIRIGVAVGEAGCVPPAHSLIADYFTRAERPRAVATYMQGPQLAMIFGYFGAGWLNQFLGWRATFGLIGIPGIFLAILAGLTLVEPRRTGTLRAPAAEAARLESDMASSLNLRETLAALWSNVAFRHLLACFSVWYFFGYGVLQWQPTFFIRSHGLTSGEVGTWFALTYGVVGGIGVYVGGELASRLAANNERLQLNASAVSFSFFAILTAASFLVSSEYTAFVLLALSVLGGNICSGPIIATMQTIIAPPMRARSIALVYLFANLIGLGIGPLAAGALSDALRPWLGQESLRYALVFLCPGYFWAAWHLWRAGLHVARSLPSVQHTAPNVQVQTFAEAPVARCARRPPSH